MYNQNMNEGNYSKDEMAKKILGLRDTGYMPVDQPGELGYHCPVCEYELIDDGNIDERLYWSEYNYCLWCRVCNKDYPTIVCVDPDKSLKKFIEIISYDRLDNE